MYADDIQLFITVDPPQITTAIEKMESCVRDINVWLDSNRLSLNAAKTEATIIGTSRALLKLPPQPIHFSVRNHTIATKVCVRDLGVQIDNGLTFHTQTNKMCRSAFSSLRVISKQRKYLDTVSTQQLVNAFVLPHLDYCSTLLHGITKKLMTNLQRVINYSIKLIFKLNRGDSVSSHMNNMGWLSVQKRIQHRFLCMIYNILSTGEPRTLSNILIIKSSEGQQTGVATRSSSDRTLLIVPRCATKLGGRALRHAAPTAWNKLPAEIRESNNRSLFRHLCHQFLMNEDK
jgi:hypothetical protein